MSGQRERAVAVLAAAAVLACLAGLWLIAAGIAVPLKATAAQHRLEGEFEQALAVGIGARMEGHAEQEPVLTLAAKQRPASRGEQGLPSSAVVARLTVPRLDVQQIVLAGNGTHEQLAEAPVMIRRDDDASPVTVLAAHRDTHFLFVRDLATNDEIQLQLTTGEVRRYRVIRFETVRRDNFAIPLSPARPLLALSTCYPFGGTEYGGPWRRIAWAVQEPV